MKATEFLEKLRETPRKWKLDSIGRIRCDSGLCPIEATAGTGRFTAYNTGGPRLGLPEPLIDRIVAGADFTKTSYWRKHLLKACGLE